MFWLPVILWAGVIFFLSSFANPYQALLPKSIQDGTTIHLINNTFQTEKIGEVSHLFAYFVLGCLIKQALNHSSLSSVIYLPWGIAILYSLSDEFHQLFVPGRTFQLIDLALDSFGALIGILLYSWVSSHQRTSTHVE
jgi:VanZ family protein